MSEIMTNFRAEDMIGTNKAAAAKPAVEVKKPAKKAAPAEMPVVDVPNPDATMPTAESDVTPTEMPVVEAE